MNLKKCARGVCLALALIAVVPAASAQQATPGSLDAELERRDAMIRELQRRLDVLERRQEDAAPGQRIPDARGGPPARRTTESDAGVDEALLERALERSLQRSGASLLRPGQKELELGGQFDFSESSGLRIADGFVVDRDYRRDNFIATAGFRAGLPWTSQVDVVVPFGRQKVQTSIDGASGNASRSGLGDVQVGITKQLFSGPEGQSALLGNLTYSRATGDSNLASLVVPAGVAGSTSLGAGYDSLSARLTAVKRWDPVVVVGSYTHAFARPATVEGARVRAADSDALSVRAILAASPDISLKGGFTVSRAGDTRVDGMPVPGTRATIGLLELGGSVALSRKTLVDIGIGIGLTDAAPKFVLNFAIPIRF